VTCHVTGSRHVNDVDEAKTVAVGVSCAAGVELTAADGELLGVGVSAAIGVERLVQAVSTSRTNSAEALMPAETPITAIPLLADGMAMSFQLGTRQYWYGD
jgi:hypothetical protein